MHRTGSVTDEVLSEYAAGVGPRVGVQAAGTEPALPTGEVTFLFTDVEGSTRLWERHAEGMRVALARHDTLIERAVAESGRGGPAHLGRW